MKMRNAALPVRIVLALLVVAACAAVAFARPVARARIAVAGTSSTQYSHVWITVTEIRFHTSPAAGSAAPGWLRFPLAAPVSVDLANLPAGGIDTLWSSASLPAGKYRQVRLILARTDGSLAPSATAAGLTYNNEVDVAGATPAGNPLRVPSGDLRLAGTFTVTETDPLNIAVVADPDHEVVKGTFRRTAVYFLKPVHAAYDLNTSGAIKGSVAFANMSSHDVVVKAEQPKTADDATSYRIVRRTAVVAADGTFTLYPLPPGTYDIVIRGRQTETVVITGVPVAAGSDSVAATAVAPALTLTAGTDYKVNAAAHPTGASVSFYQTLPTDPVPYEVRYRQLNPVTGTFTDDIALSAGALHVGAYNNGEPVTFATVSPVEGDGAFRAAAEAKLYGRSDYLPVTPSTTTVDFGYLSVLSPAVPRQAAGTILVPPLVAGTLDAGALFALHQGEIIDRLDIGAVVGSGGSFAIGNLPGGTADTPFPAGIYSLYAMGWNSVAPRRSVSFGSSALVDLSTTDASGIALRMTLPRPLPRTPDLQD